MLSAWTRKCQENRKGPGETLADVLEPSLRICPDEVCIFFEDRQITYRELDEAANRIASALVDLGVRPGDRVAMHLDNRPELIEVYFGVMRAGAVLVPTNVMYTAEEMQHILSDSGAKVIFVLAGLAQKIASIAPALGELTAIVEVLGQSLSSSLEFTALKAKSAPRRPEVSIDPEGLAFIQYTSGTTGKPKGAMVRHRNVLAVLESTIDLPGGIEGREDDRILLVLPLFHAYALNLAINRAVLSCHTIVLVNRFDAHRVLSLMEKHRVTIFYGAPPMYFAFVNTEGADRHDLSSLRAAFSGAAPLPVVILEKFKALSGVEICEGYGLSETAPTLSSNAAGAVNKPGSVGPPIPGVELRIVDAEGRDVVRGEVGEIIARGPNIFKGYWNRPAETAEAIRDGWFYTGDLGRIDEDGYYYIVDRKKDMILVSGYNVYPIEVENVILRHEKVIDCAVIGVPDSYSGERVKAVVVLKPGAELGLEELEAYCREHLAAFKVPRLLEVRDALPKNPTGKVLKRELRA